MRLNSACPNSQKKKAKKEWLKAPNFTLCDLSAWLCWRSACWFPGSLIFPDLSILEFPGNPTLLQPCFSYLGINMWHTVEAQNVMEGFHWVPLRAILLTCEQHTILEDTLHHFQKLVFHTLRAATRALLSSKEGKGNTKIRDVWGQQQTVVST